MPIKRARFGIYEYSYTFFKRSYDDPECVLKSTYSLIRLV